VGDVSSLELGAGVGSAGVVCRVWIIDWTLGSSMVGGMGRRMLLSGSQVMVLMLAVWIDIVLRDEVISEV